MNIAITKTQKTTDTDINVIAMSWEFNQIHRKNYKNTKVIIDTKNEYKAIANYGMYTEELHITEV